MTLRITDGDGATTSVTKTVTSKSADTGDGTFTVADAQTAFYQSITGDSES